MSKQSLDQVLQRASSDARFRASLSDNFDGAIRSYGLSSEERAQLAKGLGLSHAASARPMARSPRFGGCSYAPSRQSASAVSAAFMPARNTQLWGLVRALPQMTASLSTLSGKSAAH